MSEFEFRLRFHFPEGDHIEHDAEELVVFEDETGNYLRLKSGKLGIPIKELSRVALIGGPYQSEGEAYKAAMNAKCALLKWAITKGVGVDLGDDKLRSGLTSYHLRQLEAQYGWPLRNDHHGIDVYPRQEGLRFISLGSTNLGVDKTPQEFIQTVANSFRRRLQPTDKQVVACELYCSSFFDTSYRSRLVTLVSAVEALLELPDRSRAACDLVDQLNTMVRNSDLDNATQEVMISHLAWLYQESIGQTARALSQRLLPDRRYYGMDVSSFINFCYRLRSDIVHRGHPSDRDLDLLEVASACQTYVADLLRASLEVSAS